jgi:hypothetical protein
LLPVLAAGARRPRKGGFAPAAREEEDRSLEVLEQQLGRRSPRNGRAYDDLRFTLRRLAEQERLEPDVLRDPAAKIRTYLETLRDREGRQGPGPAGEDGGAAADARLRPRPGGPGRGAGHPRAGPAPELRDGLQAVVVQAFSDGWVNNASGKLHTLVIGAPAVGKKLLSEAAQRLNPTFQEAHPSKATAAGVCSTAVQKDGQWVSRPGYLPLADGGVFVVQDFHAVKDAQRERLLGIFNMVMEDGRVIYSTAARTTHPALASIHLDTNKRSDLFPDSQLRGDTIIARRLDDIRIPMTILSRFDFIIDIPRDAERQMEVSLAMYDRPGDVQGPRSPAARRAGWGRQLRVLVAVLRTDHEAVRFPEAIRTHMRARQRERWERIADALQRLPWLSDFQARLTNSVLKYVAACARMNGRGEPIRDDVDHAFRLIGRKFEFVATLAQHLNLARAWEVPGGRGHPSSHASGLPAGRQDPVGSAGGRLGGVHPRQPADHSARANHHYMP